MFNLLKSFLNSSNNLVFLLKFRARLGLKIGYLEIFGISAVQVEKLARLKLVLNIFKYILGFNIRRLLTVIYEHFH